MGNIFVNIPVPAGNGSGAPVNMTLFGPSKTISVTGPFVAAVNIEISNELVPVMWSPLITFTNSDGITIDVACRWMRATVTAFKGGTPACDVGGVDSGTQFSSLPVPVGNGAGAAIDVSVLGIFKTATVHGPFGGNVQIEVSEDGITRWSQMGFGFLNPGQQSQIIAARFMRVVRSGVPLIAPGLPIVDVAGCELNGGAMGPPGPPGPPGPVGQYNGVTVTFAMSPYSILTTDDYLFVDTTGGPVVLLLPDPTAFGYSKEYRIVDIQGTFGSNFATLTPFAAERIEGLAAPKNFQTAWGGWTIITDQVDWYSF